MEDLREVLTIWYTIGSVSSTRVIKKLWYEYISGDNNELRKTIDAMLAKEEKFTEERNKILYRQFFEEKDEKQLAKLREDLQKFLETILREISGMSGQTERYEAVVTKSVDKLSGNVSIPTIRKVVNEIIVETKKIGNFGKAIKEMVKGRDFLARFGGEEFAVILPRTSLPGAKTVAENIRCFFAQAKLKSTVSSKKLGGITVSIGAACYRPGEPLEDFINRSDQALYFAKNAGRNRVATESEVVGPNVA